VIPTIGLMIGTYIIVRMLDLITQRIHPGLGTIERMAVIGVKVCAVVCIIVTAAAMTDLYSAATTASEVPTLPPGLRGF
jgi:hypothetical protein